MTCRNPDHWTNILLYSECFSCGRNKFSSMSVPEIIKYREEQKALKEYPEFKNTSHIVTEREAITPL